MEGLRCENLNNPEALVAHSEIRVQITSMGRSQKRFQIHETAPSENSFLT